MDLEGKQERKFRHPSTSSSLDDASSNGPGGACPPGCPHDPSCRWTKESSTGSGGKKSKGKLRKKCGGGSKIEETREDVEARLLEQRSTNSSEFDSLSGSLPSVADSHCSHLSEFSCSDHEFPRPLPPSLEPYSRLPIAPPDAGVTPLAEVENDRLETCPVLRGDPTNLSPPLPGSPEGVGGTLLFIAEENIGLIWDSEPLDSLVVEEDLKENNNNNTTTASVVHQQLASPARSGCIQTNI